ncbi:MAG: FAD-binding oxidoreductase [Candidatus Micrarchaeaceae archaeon]
MITDKEYVLVEIFKETPDTYSFKFKAKDNSTVDFSPGMFMMLTYADKSTGEKISRAFSIASPPNSDYLEFFIHLIHGRFTSKLETAKIGDIYYVSGPYGQFKFDEASDKKVLFLAGGTGIAPFVSIMRYISSKKLGTDVVLIYSIRRPDEEIGKRYLESLANEIKLKLAITVTRPEPTDQGCGETGHINEEMIKKYAPDVKDRTVYICGPIAFAQAMKEILEGIGMPKEMIKADIWG